MAIIGIDATYEEMLETGDRLSNLERTIWVREAGQGKVNGQVIIILTRTNGLTAKKLQEALDEYYRLQGWDLSTGWQTRPKLEEPGLEGIADGLKAWGSWHKLKSYLKNGTIIITRVRC